MLTQTTELSAVNFMLAAVGEAPITNLEADLAESEIARSTLEATSREVQSRGWSWNTQRNREMPLASNGEILLPVNTLKVDVVDSYSGRTNPNKRVAARQNKLYDLLERTFVFEEKQNLDLVLGLDFDDITESARNYIKLFATSRYMQTVLGSDVDMQAMQQQAQIAWVQLEQEEDELGDLNFVTGNPLSQFTALRTRILG
jgi:hypothetical protein